jgi:hypothetical protein
VTSQSSKPLFAAAALILAVGAYHYATAGSDFRDVLPLPERYDLARDPRADILSGMAQARAARKRVLLEIGGDWCPPCENMDRFLRDDPGLNGMADADFVVVRVAVPQNRTNIPALRSLPNVDGYPHLFVLDPDGRLIASKETDDFEKGDSYDAGKVAEFLYANRVPDPAQAVSASSAAVSTSSAPAISASPRPQ